MEARHQAWVKSGIKILGEPVKQVSMKHCRGYELYENKLKEVHGAEGENL